MNCEIATKFPLSYQQARAWQQQLKAATSRATCWVELTGAVDSQRLRECVRKIVGRYEILRATFSGVAGFGAESQSILDGCAFAWTHEDLKGGSATAQAKHLERWLDEQVENGEPGSEPPLRAFLATLSRDSHVLLLSLPAFCADAASMAHLAGLIARAYSGDFPSTDDVLQYSDFAVWQRELERGEEAQAGRDFWDSYSRRLQSANWGRAWPATFSARHQELQNRTCTIELSRVTIAELDAYSSSRNIPSSTVLLAGWHLFLSRVSNLPTQLINVEFDGRNYQDFEDAIGPFARWIPCETAADPGTNFGDFVASLHRQSEELRNWQQSYTGLVHSEPSGVTQAPELAFDYLASGEMRASAGLQFKIVRVSSCGEDSVLRLSARRGENSLALEFHFDPSKLHSHVVADWAQSYETLLTAALQAPDQPVDLLPLLSEAQRHRTLIEWNQTAGDYPRMRCMHELIEEQVARTPDRIAVRCLDRALTYRELNTRANQLAHWLRARGVGPNDQVGLCIDRSLEMVVGILGILKTGGAYVPLSPEHPPARLAQQLQSATALVTEEKSLACAAEFRGAVICLDRDKPELRALPQSNPPRVTTPDNLVYVLFTSGSTGVPKGVAVCHRNLVNYTWFARRMLGLEKFPNGLQFAMVSTVCADVGITCIYPALTSGGCLHVIPYDVATDSARYGAYATREQIDVLKIVPSHLEALLSADGGKAVLPRKFVVVGGERLTRELMNKITAEGVGCEVVNHYAPTETTCGSLTLRLSSFDWRNWQGASIPLGRPIANTRLYVLDAHRQPLPIGAKGELYIAGGGVSAGYVGDPKRTAERFLPDPFEPGSTVYRSGDIVRYLPDGNIEFIDRIDDQVKIRGFRVELGEVQAAMETHPRVKQAVALAREARDSGRRLLGWVVANEGASVTGEEVRAHLRQRLPDYMVPSRIVVLAKFPLTRNGKIDRQGLPEPEEVVAHTGPRTAMEEAVAATWREVLRRDAIGVEENFFDLGGHSLLATQIIARLRKRLGREIPVRSLFEHPTIASLAGELEIAKREAFRVAPPPIRRVPRNAPLPLSFAQEGIWVRDQIEPNTSLYNIPRAWRLTGPLNSSVLQRALDEIVRRHESQRTTFRLQDGQPAQIIANFLHIPIATYDLTYLEPAQRDESCRRIIDDEARRPFDLERGPLVRAHLVRLAEKDHVLMIVSHHIISDAWSAGVFFRELRTVYEAFSRGDASPLPPVEIQYADYAVHEREWLQGNVLKHYLNYWREELVGAPNLLSLPLDCPRSRTRSGHGSCETVRLSRQVSRAVKRLAKDQATTPFTVLMSAFQTLLWQYSGQRQIVIGTDVANRNAPEVENVLGFFVNVLPIRGDFSGEITFLDLLGHMRQSLLRAYAHQQLPFSRIVQELQPERSSSHHPVVQALFVFQNAPDAEKSLAGLRVETFPVPVSSSKFDLAVFMAEDGDEYVAYWVYATDLFERSTVSEMALRFETLLHAVTINPEGRLASLDRFHASSSTCEKTDARCAGFESPTPTARESSETALPETATELAVASIWCDVLQRREVAADENLFEIGGHSLIATQIAARLRSRFGRGIYVRMVFDHPTIRDLSRAIDTGRGQSIDNVESPIPALPRVAAKV